jgi:hypothetical protein
MTMIICLPFIYWLSGTVASGSIFFDIMNSIHEKPFIIDGLSISTIAFAAIMIGSSILNPEKEVVIKEKEEF